MEHCELAAELRDGPDIVSSGFWGLSLVPVTGSSAAGKLTSHSTPAAGGGRRPNNAAHPRVWDTIQGPGRSAWASRLLARSIISLSTKTTYECRLARVTEGLINATRISI